MIAPFTFQETSPSSAGASPSANPVSSGFGYAPGVAAPLEDVDSLDIVAEIGSPTGGDLDVYCQMGLADGTWVDCVHFATRHSGDPAVVYKTTIGNVPTASAAPTVVGTGTTPALAPGVTIQGHGTDRMRLLMVAGSGTSAGAPVKVTIVGQRSASLPRH